MAKEADKPSPRRYVGRTASFNWGQRHPTNPTGAEIPTMPPKFFSIDNWVSPMSPTSVVARPQGRETGQGVNEVGGSESRPVIGRIGPRERRYLTRKGADFRQVLAVRKLSNATTLGEVRR
jgi:hypothetical protein